MDVSADVLNSIRIMNHSTLRVPYESLNKTFRAVQKQMDKDISLLSKNADELMKAKTQGDVSLILTGVIDKLSKLKRKAGNGIEEEVDHLQSAKRRLDYLRSSGSCDGGSVATTGNGGGCGSSPSPSSSSQQAASRRYWERRRVACMMVDYFLRHGLHATARRLARLHDVEQLTSLPYFAACQGVEQTLLLADTTKAVAWCAEHRSKLRKLGSNFEFQLRLQEFVKLVQEGKRMEAVKHARKHLSPEATSAADSEGVGGAPPELIAERSRSLCEAMALLAMPCGRAPPEKYRHLTEPAVWQRLVEKFRQVN